MARDPVALFDDWAADGRGERMATTHARTGVAALELLAPTAGERCVDLGCGTGWATRWLAERVQPGGEVIGVDAAPRMLDIARQTGGLGTRYLHGRLLDLPLPDASVDAVFSMEALYYVDIQSALHEAARITRPGGRLVLAVDYHTDNPDSHSWPRELDVDMQLCSATEWARATRRAGYSQPSRSRRGPTLILHALRAGPRSPSMEDS